jgi:hypothetical protein
MLVYRVEDSEHGGPYNGSMKGSVRCELVHLFACMGDHEMRHPTPYEDIPGWRDVTGRERFHFGFASLEQLRAWFSEHERSTLRRLGFGVAVYNVEPEHALTGMRQVAFDRSKAARSGALQSLT